MTAHDPAARPASPSDGLTALATRPVSASDAAAIRAALASASDAERDRLAELAARMRARAPRLLATLGLVLVGSSLAATPARADTPAPDAPARVVTVPCRDPERGPSIGPAQPRPMQATGSGGKGEAGKKAGDLAGAMADWAAMLGFAPPPVSVDDLEQFIAASFVSQTSSPYRQDDPLLDPLDRGLPLPVTGDRPVLGTLQSACRQIATLPGESAGTSDGGTAPRWPAFAPGTTDPLEQAAWEAYHAGDVGTFRHHLFSVLERAPQPSERTFVLALALSLDTYDPAVRNAWLDRIAAWRAGTTGSGYTAAHTEQAAWDWATGNDGPTSQAGAARLLDSYLDRVLAAATAERDAQARIDPGQARPLAIPPTRPPLQPLPGLRPPVDPPGVWAP